MNGVDPQTWLADTLTRIATHPAHRLDELLPWNWTPAMTAAAALSLAQRVSKVHHVHTIARVAFAMLGEDEDWLRDVAIEMDQEDGLIWVYGPVSESVMAFTDFGIKTLTGLIEICWGRSRPSQTLNRPKLDDPAAHAACLRSKRAS